MIALFDVGNTHTHIGMAKGGRVMWQMDVPTEEWRAGKAQQAAANFFGREKVEGAALCSVVPAVTPRVARFVKTKLGVACFVLTAKTACGVGIDYPAPETIGPDRLANAIAAKRFFGAPVVVVDFGTAVTFDVVDRSGNYAGGVIAPGLSVMTDYLHEKTALLPRIQMRDVKAVIGKNTTEAMLIGAVHGYRGLVRELILRLRKELGARRLPVVATGGYAALIAKGMPEITKVMPSLTLDGLRLAWAAHFNDRGGSRPVNWARARIFKMPKIVQSFPHALGVDEAKRRVNHLVAETRVKFSDILSEVEESWNGNVQTFRFRAMGFEVNGTIEVQANTVGIQMHYPWAALPFKGRVESELAKHTKQLLA